MILLDEIPWMEATARFLAELKVAPTATRRRGSLRLLRMVLLLKAPAANVAGNQQQRPNDAPPPLPHRTRRDGGLYYDFSFILFSRSNPHYSSHA
jgi:hypothetical protein